MDVESTSTLINFRHSATIVLYQYLCKQCEYFFLFVCYTYPKGNAKCVMCMFSEFKNYSVNIIQHFSDN